MKKVYIKPNVEVTKVTIGNLLNNGSPVGSVTGADGLGKGQGEFVGGAGDAKGRGDYDFEGESSFGDLW
jgi:hypothetical protein